MAASIKFRENPKWDVDRVRGIAAQCNKQKYNAKKAGEMSTELYTLKYIELNSPMVTEAVVVEVKEKYIDVIIVAVGLNRRIFFNSVCILHSLQYIYSILRWNTSLCFILTCFYFQLGNGLLDGCYL